MDIGNIQLTDKEIQAGNINIPVIKGAPGKDGYTPVKGKDYWTTQDKEEIVQEINQDVNDKLEAKANKEEVEEQLETKVDKEEGKGLSEENFTIKDKEKLESIVPESQAKLQGTSFHIPDSAEAPMKISPRGNIGQEGEPSSENPIPVKYVGGKFKSYNKYNKNDVVNDYFVVQTITSNADWCYSVSEDYVAGKTYYKTGGRIIIAFYNGDTNISFTNYDGDTQFTVPENTTKVYVSVQKTNIDKIQIVEGTEEKPYLPYGEVGSVYEIAKVNKNICSGIESGNINSSGINYNDTASIRSKNYDLVQPNTSYIASKNGVVSGFNVSEYDSNKAFIKRTYYSNGMLTTSSTTKYVKVQTGGSITDEIQIEKGNVITAYTAHQQQNHSLDLTNLPLYSKNDYIYKSGDKWFVHNEYGKKILNGTENWSYNATANAYRYYLDDDINLYADTSVTTILSIYSNKFKAVTMENTWNNITGISGAYSTSFGYSRLNLCYVSNETDTVDKFKEWLAKQSIYIIYKLATPTETEITDETVIAQLEELYNTYAYDEVTNISVDNPILSAPLILDVQYYIKTALGLETKVSYEEYAKLLKRVEQLEAQIGG